MDDNVSQNTQEQPRRCSDNFRPSNDQARKGSEHTRFFPTIHENSTFKYEMYSGISGNKLDVLPMPSITTSNEYVSENTNEQARSFSDKLKQLSFNLSSFLFLR